MTHGSARTRSYLAETNDKQTMNIQKVVFILGAGASRSISPNIPVMADFFEKCLPYLQDPKAHPVVWLAFAILEQCRCFPAPHRQLENAAAYAIAMHWHLLELDEARVAKDSPEYKRTEHSWLEWIQLYQRLCEKEESRIHANLEVVFAEAERKLFESRKTGDVLDGGAYIRLVFAVQYLFSHLLQRFPDSAPHAQLADLLSAWLNAHSGRSATFISFNYDVWLERALQKVGIWHPYRGYQYQFEQFMNLESARRASQTLETRTFRAIGDNDTLQKQPFTVNPSHKVSVLKPHGSLSWYVEDKKSSDCVVLLEDTQDSLVAVLDKWHLQGNFDFASDDIVSIYVPFIVPPTQLKRRQHPAFWQIDRRIFQVLSEADAVVSIGWSMPETDRDFQQKVTHAMEHRHKQLERFIICNFDPGEKDLGFYRRMESVFRPARKTEILGEGFSTDSLERVFDLLREGGEKPEPVQTTASR